MALTKQSLLDALNAKLRVAQDKYVAAQKDFVAIQRRRDRAEEAVLALKEDIAFEQLRLWGNAPDLRALLKSPGGMIFYRALGALAEYHGMRIGGEWVDTKQVVLGFGLNRSEVGAVERIAGGIRYFAPAVKSIKGGWVRFSVSHRDAGACAWELLYSVKRENAQLVQMVYGREHSTLPFSTLEAALRHVEANLWVEDVIDMMPDLLPA